MSALERFLLWCLVGSVICLAWRVWQLEREVYDVEPPAAVQPKQKLVV
jgi:hypothetical protein